MKSSDLKKFIVLLQRLLRVQMHQHAQLHGRQVPVRVDLLCDTY